MRIFLISIIVILTGQSINAQFFSSYHEQQLAYGPQPRFYSNFYQPKSKRPKKLTIILPSVSVSLLSPELTYGEMYDADTKTLDLVHASESGKDYNLQLNTRASYGGLAYRVKNIHISLFHEFIADAHLNVPNQIFELITEGNNKFRESTVDINPYGFLQSVHKWSLGVDYQWEHLMAGVQFNMYTGNAHLNTNDSRLSIDFDENFFEFGFDKDINVQSSGVINYNSVDSVDVLIANNVYTGAGSFQNLGFGVSAQFRYEPSESLKVFGRIEDVGYVKWNHEAETLVDQSRSEFGGVDIRRSYVTGETYSIEDTLYSKLDIDRQVNGFKSPLLYSLFFGVDYRLSDVFSFGGTLRTRNNSVQQLVFVEPQVTIRPIEHLSFSVGNIMTRMNLLNPKFVLNTELGQTFGFNLSVVNPWKFGKYYEANMLHASLGMYIKLFRID